MLFKGIALLILLAIIIIVIFFVMGKFGSGSNGGGGGGILQAILPKPKTKPIELKSRFDNTPKSLGGPPKQNIDASGDFNFTDPNEGKSLFCRFTHLC